MILVRLASSETSTFSSYPGSFKADSMWPLVVDYGECLKAVKWPRSGDPTSKKARDSIQWKVTN